MSTESRKYEFECGCKCGCTVVISQEERDKAVAEIGERAIEVATWFVRGHRPPWFTGVFIEADGPANAPDVRWHSPASVVDLAGARAAKAAREATPPDTRTLLEQAASRVMRDDYSNDEEGRKARECDRRMIVAASANPNDPTENFDTVGKALAGVAEGFTRMAILSGQLCGLVSQIDLATDRDSGSWIRNTSTYEHSSKIVGALGREVGREIVGKGEPRELFDASSAVGKAHRAYYAVVDHLHRIDELITTNAKLVEGAEGLVEEIDKLRKENADLLDANAKAVELVITRDKAASMRERGDDTSREGRDADPDARSCPEVVALRRPRGAIARAILEQAMPLFAGKGGVDGAVNIGPIDLGPAEFVDPARAASYLPPPPTTYEEVEAHARAAVYLGQMTACVVINGARTLAASIRKGLGF